MMPKSTLIAPAGISGQIHASHSGKNYDIDGDGTVVVDAVDVASLLGAGFQHVPPTADHRDIAPNAAPVGSDAVGSNDVGANALDPADREKLRRETPAEIGQENHDHGDAAPPHGEPIADVSTDATKAEARAEVDTAARSGVDTEHRSEVAGTGHMDANKVTASDQDAARGESPAV